MFSNQFYSEVSFFQSTFKSYRKLHVKEGRSYKSLSDEFGISARAIGCKVRKLRAETEMDEMKAKALGDMNEIRRLQDELAEVKKENDFLKKLAAFYAKETN